jgi:hypothetical protein
MAVGTSGRRRTSALNSSYHAPYDHCIAKRAVGRPAVRPAPKEAPRRHAVGCGEIGIKFDGPVEQLEGFADAVAVPLIDVRHPAQKVIVGIETLGRLSLGTLDLCLLQLRRYGTDNARRDVVLEVENILKSAVKAIGPEVSAGGGVDELSGDAHAAYRFAHAALKDVADTELASDLLHVHRSPLIGKARIACDHEQPTHAREGRDDILHDTVSKILLLRVAAEIGERKNGNRGSVQKRKAPEALPEVPTISDFVPGFETSAWFGIGAPRNTPIAIIDKLNIEINAALADPKLEARLADLGATVAPGSSSDFGKLVVDETEKWAKVIKFSGLKAD